MSTLPRHWMWGAGLVLASIIILTGSAQARTLTSQGSVLNISERVGAGGLQFTASRAYMGNMIGMRRSVMAAQEKVVMNTPPWPAWPAPHTFNNAQEARTTLNQFLAPKNNQAAHRVCSVLNRPGSTSRMAIVS